MRTRQLSEEDRTRRSERMSKLNATRLASRPADIYKITVEADWHRMPMPIAQQAYAELQKEFNRAGTILNARSVRIGDKFTCHVCNTEHDRPARYVNNGYRNPLTGLMVKIECCGERCAQIFEQQLITERRRRGMVERSVDGS